MQKMTFESRPSRRHLLSALAAAPLASALPLRTSRAASGKTAGFDPALLDRAAEKASGLDQLHSLVIARNGEIAFGEAFRGAPLDRPVNVKSVSKTFVASLTGVAIERGILEGVDQRAASLLGKLVPAKADPKVREITVEDLLTMRAGLERTSGPNYGSWVQSRNWIADALERPFVAEPGSRMLYSTGSYHLLGAALANATDRSLLALARDWLGEPLDITFPPWTRDPQGFYMGGNNMAVSPLGLLRFGEMWRLEGLSNGKRVLGKDWIRASWTPRTRSPFSGHSYGYGWFLGQTRGAMVAYARGYGGQMLYVVPSLGLTVVVTSDPNRPGRSRGYEGELNAMLVDDIIPAAERA